MGSWQEFQRPWQSLSEYHEAASQEDLGMVSMWNLKGQKDSHSELQPLMWNGADSHMGNSRENVPGWEEPRFIYLFWLNLFSSFRQSEIFFIKKIKKELISQSLLTSPKGFSFSDEVDQRYIFSISFKFLKHMQPVARSSTLSMETHSMYFCSSGQRLPLHLTWSTGQRTDLCP